MPDNSPVASGWFRSSSMMKRSIVTTDVAVCLTTLSYPFGVGLPDARRRIRASVRLKAIPNIAVAHGLPQVAKRERPARLKLLNVAKLMQEQLDVRLDVRSEPVCVFLGF